MKPDLIPGFEELLLDLNRVSAEVILPLFRSDHGLEDKGGETGFDPVTMADRGAEAAIRRRLAEVVPEHGVIGEEYGEDRPDREFVWVLDPVDGTRAFIAGLPVWTTSRPLRVRPCLGLSVATIASTDPIAYFGADEKAAWDRVRAAARLARLGCDAYAYAMVAAGAIDLVLESRACKCWDIEAAAPLLAGAGGVATDWNGMPIGLNGGQLVVAGDRACLDEALPLLKSAAD